MTLPKALTDYSARFGFPDSKTMHRILEIHFENDEEKKIAEALPGTAEQIIKKTGFSSAKVDELIKILFWRGSLRKKEHNGDVTYLFFTALGELRDSSVLCPDAKQELYALWEQIYSVEMDPLISVAKSMDLPAVLRVLPVEKTIKSKDTVLDADSAKKIFMDADLISVIPCACRKSKDKMGKRDPDCPAPKDSVCMQINKFARVSLERGIGQEITKEEALRRLNEAEEAGLVHLVRNNIKKDMFMCNCCSCCCLAFQMFQLHDYTRGMAQSRFIVKLDEDACSACGLCVERCQFHAINVDNDTAEIDFDICYGCGNCVTTCPEEALELIEARPLEHIRVK